MAAVEQIQKNKTLNDKIQTAAVETLPECFISSLFIDTTLKLNASFKNDSKTYRTVINNISETDAYTMLSDIETKIFTVLMNPEQPPTPLNIVNFLKSITNSDYLKTESISIIDKPSNLSKRFIYLFKVIPYFQQHQEKEVE